jgi:NADP-dependent 3-hydroxy acid dehydrogenase YdfG
MKTFLSIGTGPGIGLATAERFAKEGFRVVVSARTSEKTNSLVEKLKAKGYQAEARTVEAGDPNSVQTLISSTEKEFGSIDVLHFNAASMRQATVQNQPAESFNTDLAVNIGGALAAVQASSAKMIENKTGTILLTGGGFAVYPHPDYISLSIGKAGIRALTLGLFDTFREQGVHIASVTVSTNVTPESKEATEISENFWKLHNESSGNWTAEITYPSNN